MEEWVVAPDPSPPQKAAPGALMDFLDRQSQVILENPPPDAAPAPAPVAVPVPVPVAVPVAVPVPAPVPPVHVPVPVPVPGPDPGPGPGPGSSTATLEQLPLTSEPQPPGEGRPSAVPSTGPMRVHTSAGATGGRADGTQPSAVPPPPARESDAPTTGADGPPTSRSSAWRWVLAAAALMLVVWIAGTWLGARTPHPDPLPVPVVAPVPVAAPAPVVAPAPVAAPAPDVAPAPVVARAPDVAPVPDTAAVSATGEPATDAARSRAREATSPMAPRVATARTPMKADAPGARDQGSLVVSCARRCTVRVDGAMSPAATAGGARVRPGRHVVIVTDGQTGLALTMHVDVPAGMTLQKRVTF